MKKTYKIIFDDNPFKFEDKVSDAINKGYELVGGPMIVRTKKSGKAMISKFNQAVLWSHASKPAPSLT